MFRPISFVKTPPSVSIPSDSGVTSNSRTSVTSPARTPPCTAASFDYSLDGHQLNILISLINYYKELNANKSHIKYGGL